MLSLQPFFSQQYSNCCVAQLQATFDWRGMLKKCNTDIRKEDRNAVLLKGGINKVFEQLAGPVTMPLQWSVEGQQSRLCRALQQFGTFGGFGGSEDMVRNKCTFVMLIPAGQTTHLCISTGVVQYIYLKVSFPQPKDKDSASTSQTQPKVCTKDFNLRSIE